MRSIVTLIVFLVTAARAYPVEFSFVAGTEILPEFSSAEVQLSTFTTNKIIVGESFAYDGDDGNFLYQLTGSGGMVTLTDAHDDFYVANCPRCNESPVLLWDVDTNSLLRRFVVDETNFTLSPPGFWGMGVAVGENYVASADQRGNTAVFSIATGEQVLDLPVERGPDFTGQSGVDFFGDKLLTGSTGNGVDGALTQSVILVDIPSGEIELEIAAELRDGLAFGVGVGLSDDALFIHDNFQLLKYDYEGNLLASVASPPGVSSQVEYADGYVRVFSSIYDEDLNLVLEHPNRSHRSWVIAS